MAAEGAKTYVVSQLRSRRFPFSLSDVFGVELISTSVMVESFSETYVGRWGIRWHIRNTAKREVHPIDNTTTLVAQSLRVNHNP
jgi:hypothetical protein